MTHAPELRRHDIHPGSEGLGWGLAAVFFFVAGALLWAGARWPGGLTGGDVGRAAVSALVGVAIIVFGRRRARLGIELGPQGFRSTAPDAEWIPWSAVYDIRFRRLRQHVALFDDAGGRLAVLPLDLTSFDRALNDILSESRAAAAALARPLPATFAPPAWLRVLEGALNATALVGLPVLAFWAIRPRHGTSWALAAGLTTVACVAISVAYQKRHGPHVTTFDPEGITVQRGSDTSRIARDDIRSVAIRSQYRYFGEGGAHDLEVVVSVAAARKASHLISTRLSDPFALYYTARSIAPVYEAMEGDAIA